MRVNGHVEERVREDGISANTGTHLFLSQRASSHARSRRRDSGDRQGGICRAARP